MTETVPVHVTAALKRYDRDLRLRFSKEKKRWILERKCSPQYLMPPVFYSQREYGIVEVPLSPDADLSIQYRDGYIFICDTAEPSMRLIKELWLSDSRRIGKQFVKRLAEKWDQDEQKKRLSRISHFSDIASEVQDSLHWKQGSRSAVAGMRA